MRDELSRVDSFHVELDGVSKAGFTRCSGLARTAAVFEYHEGGYEGLRYFQDGSAGGRLILERGLVLDRELWDWFEQSDVRDGAVVLIDRTGREKTRWRFERAWPCHWEGPLFRAESNEVALERLEIVYEILRWESS